MDVPGESGTEASESSRWLAALFFLLRSDVGRRGGASLSSAAARREARWATRASSWVRTVEKGRSEGSGAGEQGLCGWCSVRWRPELFQCGGKSARK
jgi:hypothetical protein